MSTQNRMTIPINRNTLKSLITVLMLVLSTALPCAVLAVELYLSNNALELDKPLEPNVMLLIDDSNSMDWGMLVDEYEAVAHLGGYPYYYSHPDPAASGEPPAVNSDFWVVPSAEHLQANGVPFPQGGVWRYWNSNYNSLYYNPDIRYSAWSGMDANGMLMNDADPSNAFYNAYQPTWGSIDLTQTSSYWTDCGLQECQMIPALSGMFLISDFFPARYYEWNDTSITTPEHTGNGEVDADDEHTLIEIRPYITSYPGRKVYDPQTKIGRSDCQDQGDGTAVCSYAEEIQNFANWFSYYRKRDLTAKSALSRSISSVNDVKLGLASLNRVPSSNVGVQLLNNANSSAQRNVLLDTTFRTTPLYNTPLRDALDKTGKYYACQADDILGSVNDSLPGKPGCPIPAPPKGACQENYSVILSDGLWNANFYSSIGNSDANPGEFSGGAFADNYSVTLADVAMHYYKLDLHLSLLDEVNPSDYDIQRYLGNPELHSMHQHMSTYSISFGLTGSLMNNPSNPFQPFPWPNPFTLEQHKIDDLRHAAYNGRGEYFATRETINLNSALDSIFSQLSPALSDISTTALAFNTEDLEPGSHAYRAVFNANLNSGDLFAQPLDPDGNINSTVLWSAATQLDFKLSNNSDNRVIISYNPENYGQAIAFKWNELSIEQQNQLINPIPPLANDPPQVIGENRLRYLRGQSQHEGANGDAGEFRQRPVIAGKLGDIVASSPHYVGKPIAKNRDGGAYPQNKPYSQFANAWQYRPAMIYTGANDGMLHAFDSQDGSERFAYIPSPLFAKLSKLTDPNYQHEFFVNQSVAVNDAFFMPMQGTNSWLPSWNSVLVGGMGAGGKGHFAINITDPDTMDTEMLVKLNVLWEFTEEDDGGVGNSDLGFNFSPALITMSNAMNGYGERVWIVVFGNGVNSSSIQGESTLYILLLEEGQNNIWQEGYNFFKIPSGYGRAQSMDGTTANGMGGVSGVDVDNNGTTDYIYAGDTQGNVYRFDLSGYSMFDWLATPKVIFRARYAPNNLFPRDQIQRISSAPVASKHPSQSGNLLVVATGSWIEESDNTNQDIQSLYGIWDDLSNNPEVLMYDDAHQLVKQYFNDEVNLEYGFQVRSLSNNPVNWKNFGPKSTKIKGWYIDFDHASQPPFAAGERIVRNMQISGSMLIANSIIPDEGLLCETRLSGYELAINLENGGSGSDTLFDINADGYFDQFDNIAGQMGEDYIINGIAFDKVPSDARFLGNRRYTQTPNAIRRIGIRPY